MLLPLLVVAFGAWSFGPTPAGAKPPSSTTLVVDVVPTGGGADGTAPGAVNGAVCDADLGSPSKTSGSNAWDAQANDPLNSVSLICASLVDGRGHPRYGVDVTLTSSGPGVVTDQDGPEPSLSSDASAVGSDGYAWFYVSSTTAGVQSLTVSVGSAQRSATQVWEAPPAREARIIGCTPDQVEIDTGTEQSVMCSVSDGFGNPVAGAPVVWSIGGESAKDASFVSKTEVTDAQGTVAATVTSSASGRIIVKAGLKRRSSECRASDGEPDPFDHGKSPGVCADAASLQWASSAPAELSLSPRTIAAQQYTHVALTASARDAGGGPRAGVSVSFSVQGANEASRASVTDGDGRASFSYTGAAAGRDTVTAFVDDNANGRRDPEEPSATTVVRWTAVCFGYGNDPRNQVVGTSASNHLRGTRGYDIMCALGGSDVMAGRGGGDLMLGGLGNDRLDGGPGDDQLVGGPGRDVLIGDLGADQLLGGQGNDRLDGGDNVDSLHGGAGRDRLAGGKGNDDLFGDSGRDVLDGGPAVDFCREASDRRIDCER
jgi:Ca2+-binding RTX toxin-like protein